MLTCVQCRCHRSQSRNERGHQLHRADVQKVMSVKGLVSTRSNDGLFCNHLASACRSAKETTAISEVCVPATLAFLVPHTVPNMPYLHRKTDISASRVDSFERARIPQIAIFFDGKLPSQGALRPPGIKQRCVCGDGCCEQARDLTRGLLRGRHSFIQ